MAKRRRTTRRKTYTKASKRSRRKSTGGKVELLQFDSMIYGGVRGYTSKLIAPLVSKIPLGSIADEVGMGAINYFVAKNTSGMLKNVALKGLVIENARLGEAVATGDAFSALGFGSSKSSGTMGGIYIN